jgi:hypothetical protein
MLSSLLLVAYMRRIAKRIIQQGRYTIVLKFHIRQPLQILDSAPLAPRASLLLGCMFSWDQGSEARIGAVFGIGGWKLVPCRCPSQLEESRFWWGTGRDPLRLRWLTFTSPTCQLSYMAAGSPMSNMDITKVEGKCRIFALHKPPGASGSEGGVQRQRSTEVFLSGR